MTCDVAALLREASELPETDRAELAGRLLETLNGEAEERVEIAWSEEIERRIRQLDTGEVKTITWSDVRAQLYAQLDAKR